MTLSVLLGACALPEREAGRDETWAVPLTADLQAPTAAIDTQYPALSQPALGNAANQEWLERWASGQAGAPWTETVLGLIQKYQQNPPRAARILAYLHVGIHDAHVHAARNTRDDRLRDVAVHSAASAMMEYLYPQEPNGRFGAMGYMAAMATLAKRPASANDFARYWTLGQSVALGVIERSKNDRADALWNIRLRPKATPGTWEASPPLNVYRPLEPLAGKWRTWALTDATELQVAPPTPFDTPAYWAEVEEVLQVTRNLTAEQKKIADTWNLGHGTVTPAGVWNRYALEHARRAELDTAQTAKLFAALNAAMMDAFVACWNVKFTHWTQRPVTAIRAKYDPNFLPHLITPPFPSYISGHATVSGAASEVLSAFFPKEADAFSRMAEEAAMSRLYGGIHFRSDDDEGLKLGRRIGNKAVTKLGRLD